MILSLSIRLAGTIHQILYVHAPSNVLIRHLRSPNGRRWALLVSSALAVGYAAVTAGLTSRIGSGASGWLNLVTLVCAWNAIKFAWLALASAAGVVIRSTRRLSHLAKHRVAARE